MDDLFEISILKLSIFEGIYSNDPDDKGKETFRGISRPYHPNWYGWILIDNYKNKPDFLQLISNDEVLTNLSKTFYRYSFWNPMFCSQFPDIISFELFECSVNAGLPKATRIVQKTLNILNKNEKYYPDIIVDGRFGNNTLGTFKECLKFHKPKFIFKLLNLYQAKHIIEVIEKNKSYEKFLGLFNRVEV